MTLGAITVSNGQNVHIAGNSFGAADPSLSPAPQAIRLDLCRDVTVQDNTIVRRNRAIDPIVLTPRAEKTSITLRRNRLVSP
jgi:hypothetical protein